jgi:hypothetical protein
VKLNAQHYAQLACTAVAAALGVLVLKDPGHAIEWAAAMGLFAGAGNVLGITSKSATAEDVAKAAIGEAVSDALKQAGFPALSKLPIPPELPKV